MIDMSMKLRKEEDMKETYPECKRLECFANIPINARQSAGLCTVLTECIKDNCPFFKTKKEFKEGVRHGYKEDEKEVLD